MHHNKKHIPNIGIFGTFDVESYGDLLFPLIAHTELTARLGKINLYLFSYHQKATPDWVYAVQSLAELSDCMPTLDGVLIGGGHLIRFDKNVANNYFPPPQTGIHHPTGFWLSPALLALQYGIPLAWNAPGVLGKVPIWAEDLMQLVLEESDYFSVRDIWAKEQLLASFPHQEKKIILSPDTAFGIANTFPFDSKKSDILSALFKKLQITRPYILLQPIGGIESFISTIKNHPNFFEAYQIVVLPVTAADNFTFLSELLNLTYIEKWPTPACITEMIARAAFVIGSSLHLSTVAAVHHVPCFRPIIEGAKYDPLKQYTNIFHFDNADPHSVSLTWIQSCMTTFDPASNEVVLKQTRQQLDIHWDRIASLFEQGSNPHPHPVRPHMADFWKSLPNLLEKNQENIWKVEKILEDTKKNLSVATEKLACIQQSLRWRVTQALCTFLPRPPLLHKTIRYVLELAHSFKNILSTSKLNTHYRAAHQHIPNLDPPLVPTKTQVQVRAIAFYLPQFHPIPENDAWWGQGFTEWKNVTRATPQFKGHYQPHLPGELGFYDLRLPEIQARQIELAKAAGLSGFCFYFYWFNGKRLLEKPALQYLEHTEFDFPFCLCWANENWSRRWDGKDQELLISQQHSDEDDIAFISYIAKYLTDTRYIKINGKPLILVYRPSLLPDAKATSILWRTWAHTHGIGDIFLAYTQSFESVDPAIYGFDAAIEFPPNNTPVPVIPNKTVKARNKNFAGTLYDGQYFVEQSRQYTNPPYKLFRGVFPSWDNEARRTNKGTVFLNTSPQGFEEWLHNAAVDTMQRYPLQPEERLIFINAWNEWAEGAHLEPDQKYGYAWLHATKNALINAPITLQKNKHIILVSHDAHPHGAQFLALHLVHALTNIFNFKVSVVLLGNGILKKRFAKLATVHDLSNCDPMGETAQSLAKKLFTQGCQTALCNSTLSGTFLAILTQAGFKCVSLIHELTHILDSHQLHPHAKLIAKYAHAIVFPAELVKTAFTAISNTPSGQTYIRPQGLFRPNRLDIDRPTARNHLRKQLNIPPDSKIILGVGFADHRKGIDLFVKIGSQLNTEPSHVYFVWIGHWDKTAREAVDIMLLENKMGDRFIFTGLREDTDLFYLGADVFALTSREDPFPSVILEALEVGLPVVAFKDATGIEKLLSQPCGILIPLEDTKAFADAISSLLKNMTLADTLGKAGAKLIAEKFSFPEYVFDLLDMVDYRLKRISVIIPNYNYAHFIKNRLNSILKQTYPIFELIILDDCSTDNSMACIKKLLVNKTIRHKIIVNEKNSGSVFTQWKRGIEMAKGDYIWIAEADDLALPDFLVEVIDAFSDEKVVLSYCESKQMGENEQIFYENYQNYVHDISQKKWSEHYVQEGILEIQEALAIKNTIPNVSAVVFKSKVLKEVFKKHFGHITQFKIAGDWVTYTYILETGKIAFSPKSFNLHRRHTNSLTISNFNQAQLDEIHTVQSWINSKHTLSLKTTACADAHLCELKKVLSSPQ